MIHQSQTAHLTCDGRIIYRFAVTLLNCVSRLSACTGQNSCQFLALVFKDQKSLYHVVSSVRRLNNSCYRYSSWMVS